MTFPLPLVSVNADPNLATVERLSRQLTSANNDYDRWDRYYSGDQPLAYLAPEVAAQVGNRLAPMVINWPETIVDSVNRRLKLEGFTVGQGEQTDAELWRIWTANGMHEDAPLGQVDALVHGLGFISVWGNDEDPQTPLMTFESAHQMAVEYEPGTGDRVVRAALKRWQDDDRTYATLYLKDRVIRYVSRSSLLGTGSSYEVDQVLDNPLGVVPIVPMVNKGRLLNRTGRSELASVAPLADGINSLATGLMVTAEFYLTPRRYATGIQIPTDPANRERLQAEVAAYWEEATKKKTWLAGQGVDFGQFPEADLAGFVSGINLLTSALASIGGLPPDDLGLNQVNPASAEARRAAETVLVLRAEEKQDSFGPRYCRAMRMAIAARDGVPVRAVPAELSLMAAAWRDPATQAIAQSMDAAVKGKEAGLLDVEAGQKLIGISPVERAALAAREAERANAAGAAQEAPRFAEVGLPALVEGNIISLDEARSLLGITGPAPTPQTAATADVQARVELARQLQARDGLTQNAALAAAGLTQAAATNRAEGAPPPA